MKFIEITDINGKTHHVNVYNIVSVYEDTDYSIVDLSNGKTINTKTRFMVLKNKFEDRL